MDPSRSRHPQPRPQFVRRVLDRLQSGRLDLLRRVVLKKVIGPIKYRSERGYDARRFWTDRFHRYGVSRLRGAGDEGLTEDENREAYHRAALALTSYLSREVSDLSSTRVLDIGCGQGFYTQLLSDLGVRSYTAIDITDVLFPELMRRFPDYRFLRLDITSDTLDGEFDVVLMIDVVEHIVGEDQFAAAMRNVLRVLGPDGLFLIGPLRNESKRHLFYVRWWSIDDVRHHVRGLEEAVIPFRNGHLVSLRQHRTDGGGQTNPA